MPRPQQRFYPDVHMCVEAEGKSKPVSSVQLPAKCTTGFRSTTFEKSSQKDCRKKGICPLIVFTFFVDELLLCSKKRDACKLQVLHIELGSGGGANSLFLTTKKKEVDDRAGKNDSRQLHN